MPRPRSIAAYLRWATAIVLASTAFLTAVIALSGKLGEAKRLVIGNQTEASQDYDIIAIDDDPLAPYVNGQDYIADPDPIASPSFAGDPDDIMIGSERYSKVVASFAVTPPDAAKLPILKPPCGCLKRDDYRNKIMVTNTCAGDAQLSIMKYAAYPREDRPAMLPVEEGRELRSSTTYAALTLPPHRYLQVSYSSDFLIDLQVTQCSND